MATNQRNKIFGDFLRRQFTEPQSILDVACGDGRLAKCLQDLYPFASVMGVDPKPRGNKRQIRFLKGLFPGRVDMQQYDLIVGMHPDGATWPIVESCCRHRVNFAVVPCCLLHTPPQFPGGNIHCWGKFIADYAVNHGMQVVHTVLPMRGANQVICGRRTR